MIAFFFIVLFTFEASDLDRVLACHKLSPQRWTSLNKLYYGFLRQFSL